jgi:hypothetical protein
VTSTDVRTRALRKICHCSQHLGGCRIEGKMTWYLCLPWRAQQRCLACVSPVQPLQDKVISDVAAVLCVHHVSAHCASSTRGDVPEHLTSPCIPSSLSPATPFVCEAVPAGVTEALAAAVHCPFSSRTVADSNGVGVVLARMTYQTSNEWRRRWRVAGTALPPMAAPGSDVHTHL